MKYIAELNNFRTYERYLPHWRADNAIYFVTWKLFNINLPLLPAERTIVAETIEIFNGQRYQLIAYVVMDDHVHVCVQPQKQFSLEQNIHSWKSYSANQLQRRFDRKHAVWEQEYYDRIIRNDHEFRSCLTYIANNPIKRWPETVSYKWMRILDHQIN